ncbi:EF-hand domain-containing protein [Paracoccaceae bacterium Fryx2]|nr:EF-hand domain-containing protein [Paracoccaceae bacterium Fryx2]
MNRISLIAAGIALAGGGALAQTGTPGQNFMAVWDLDADGRVTVAEATEQRGNVFASFDADEDGRLTGAEYDLLDEARANARERNGMGHDMRGKGFGRGQGLGLGMGGNGSANAGMERVFNDADGDGMVSRDEFLARASDWLAMMDRDGDGAVTAQDFPGNQQRRPNRG